MVIGPFEQIALSEHASAPLYLLRYDADGRLVSRQTEAHLRDAATAATDVFVFSHGWNTIFGDALGRYRGFLNGYMKIRRDLGLPVPQPYRPILVGVIWPSTSLLLPWEQGPEIAAAGADAAETEELLRFVTESLDDEAAAELTELLDGATGLTEAQAARAAQILQSALLIDDADTVTAPPTAAEVMEIWNRLDGRKPVPPADPDDFGTVGGAVPAPAGAPQAAGFGVFDPRNLLRMGSMWKMKDRSGKVGARGLSPLLRHLLAETTARVHLTGHSFGCRLLMSALAIEPTARPARSLLLLQPAVNRWCFAADAAGTGRVGGYRPVLDRVEQPVLTTFTSHDLPLRQAFHLALRGSHVGEPQIAALGDEERYGALGGYGPAGLGTAAAVVPIKDPGQKYDLGAGTEVIALDGSRTIDGHGGISNPSTWWALHSLTAPS